MTKLRIPGSAQRRANGSAIIDGLNLSRTSHAICDICQRSRNKGDHRKCSKRRQAERRASP